MNHRVLTRMERVQQSLELEKEKEKKRRERFHHIHLCTCNQRGPLKGFTSEKSLNTHSPSRVPDLAHGVLVGVPKSSYIGEELIVVLRC